MTSKDLWKLSRSALLYIYPNHKRSYIPDDLLVFTLRFLCKEHKQYYTKEQLRYSYPHLKDYNKYDYPRYQNFYVNGKRHGECNVWYPNGQLRCRDFYRHGVKYGKHTDFWNNGKLMCLYFYVKGKLHNKWKEWDRSGKLDTIKIYNHGVLVLKKDLKKNL